MVMDISLAIPGSKTMIMTSSLIIAFSIGGILYTLQRKKKVIKIPSNWKPVGKIQNLYLYPLKSGKALEVTEAECTQLGLKEVHLSSSEENFLFQDRTFMIYQEESLRYLTARQKNATLVITVTSPGPNEVKLMAPISDKEVSFKIDSVCRKKTKCIMLNGEEIDVVDCGNEVASWLSEVLYDKPSGLRLGYYPDPKERLRTMETGVYRKYPVLKNYMTDNDFGAYSDVASYMLLSQNSLEDLKNRLGPDAEEVTVKQFRPNIVVSGSDISPYDEDAWNWVKIGDNAIMKGFKPCTRCLMVTLHPEKAKPNPEKEPLLTLKKYRQVTDPVLKEVESSSPVFGRYFGLYKNGRISVGDTIYLPA